MHVAPRLVIRPSELGRGRSVVVTDRRETQRFGRLYVAHIRADSEEPSCALAQGLREEITGVYEEIAPPHALR